MNNYSYRWADDVFLVKRTVPMDTIYQEATLELPLPSYDYYFEEEKSKIPHIYNLIVVDISEDAYFRILL